MTDSTKGSNPPPKKKSIASTAGGLRRQLDAFNVAEQRTQTKLREARDELKKALSDAEKRERRTQRNGELNSQKRAKFILGGLALTALLTQGSRAFALTAADLQRLSPKDRQLVDEVLRIGSQAKPQADSAAGSGVDIQVE